MKTHNPKDCTPERYPGFNQALLVMIRGRDTPLFRTASGLLPLTVYQIFGRLMACGTVA